MGPLLDVARAALLVGTVLAAATAAVWALRPAWVHDYDARRLDELTGRAEERLQAALAALETSPDTAGGRAPLLALVEELRGSRPGERLAPFRRRALSTLVRVHEADGDLPAALALRREMVELDPRDLELQLGLARTLSRDPELRAEARELLAGLQRRLPEDPRVAQALADRLVEDGEAGAAAEVALAQGQRSRSILWRVAWQANPKAPELQGFVSPYLGADGRLRLPVRIDGPVRFVRFEPPDLTPMRLEDAVVHLRTAKLERDYPLAEQAELTGFGVNGGVLTASGLTNPSIRLELQADRATDLTELELSADFAWGDSPVLAALASRPEFVQGLEASLDGERLARLRALTLEAVLAQPLEVFWKQGPQNFDGKRRASAHAEHRPAPGGLAFTFEVPLGQSADHLRLDPPGARGTTYELEALVLVAGEGELALDPAQVEWVSSHSLERDGARLAVAGDDPWFCVAVPEGAREPSAVRVRGTLR